ncbi:MAG: hypothetical protein FGM24_06300 [Candidatus Kapabacteria bacterium]|nr:hypothetical protein [Candidatus Kapabacteria bacterium]
MRVRQLVVLIFALILRDACLGQGGSNYSSFGLGDFRRQPGGLYEGMGGTSIAMPTMHGINLTNPALLGMSSLTRLQVGYRFDQRHVTDGSQSLNQNNGSIDGIIGSFGVDTALGIGITFGLEPTTSVDYASTKSLYAATPGDTVKGTSFRRGEGGISSIVLGASVRITGRLYAGINLRSLVGTITMYDQVSITESPFSNSSRIDTIRYNLQQAKSHEIRGLIANAGLYWEMLPSLSIGAFASLRNVPTVRSSDRIFGVVAEGIALDSTLSSVSTTSLPMTFGIGASWQRGRTRIGVDVESSDHSGMTVNTTSAVTFTSALRASLGVMYMGARQAGSSYSERVGYSAGASYQQLPFTYRGAELQEYSLSAGINFPLGSAAMVDIGISAGQRTSALQGALQDTFMRLVTTVSIGEQWFRPFARD